VDEPDNNEIKSKDEEKEVYSAAKDPRYERYFKMLHFGVPKQAVKLKMEQEGLDASILEWVWHLFLYVERYLQCSYFDMINNTSTFNIRW